MDINVIKEALMSKVNEAKEYLRDNEKLDQLFNDVEHMVSNFPVLGDYLADITILVEMVKSYVVDEYRKENQMTIAVLVACLVYLISPIDICPDILTVVGLLDDIAVIKFTIDCAKEDIDAYREWKKSKTQVKEEQGIDA